MPEQQEIIHEKQSLTMVGIRMTGTCTKRTTTTSTVTREYDLYLLESVASLNLMALNRVTLCSIYGITWCMQSSWPWVLA